MKMKKIKTGIPGFDEKFGGLQEYGLTVVSGVPGTGKTSFAIQFISYGAAHGEPGVYVTVEQKESDIVDYAKGFGHNFKSKGISVVEMPIFTSDTMMMTSLEQEIKKIDAKRLVFDSVRIFEYLYEDENQRWKSMLRFKNFLRKFEVTAVLCFEKNEKPLEIFKIEESLADTLIVLTRDEEQDVTKRFMSVLKTPGKEQFEKIHRIDIGKMGIEVFS
jgi:circadian clock protein KaiC